MAEIAVGRLRGHVAAGQKGRTTLLVSEPVEIVALRPGGQHSVRHLHLMPSCSQQVNWGLDLASWPGIPHESRAGIGGGRYGQDMREGSASFDRSMGDPVSGVWESCSRSANPKTSGKATDSKSFRGISPSRSVCGARSQAPSWVSSR